MPKATRNLNDDSREEWVLNDEGLYRDWKRSRLSMRNYIRENRAMIDGVIQGVLNRKPTRPSLYYNAAKGAEKVVRAFLEGRKAREGSRPDYMAGARYETDGQSLVQWGSVIARKVNGHIEITDAGWKTKTTMAMLNAVLGATTPGTSIYQKKHQWFIVTPEGSKPWRGSASIDVAGARVLANRSKRKNPAYVVSGMSRDGVPYGPKEFKYKGRKKAKGKLSKASMAAWRRGMAWAKKRGGGSTHITHRSGVSLNPISCLKNLHTKAEQERAKRLIDRYYVKGKAALHAGKVAVAAHCYGAIAAIRQIARGERPVPKTVVNVASFRLDLLKRLRKDLARMRGEASAQREQTSFALSRWRGGMGR